MKQQVRTDFESWLRDHGLTWERWSDQSRRDKASTLRAFLNQHEAPHVRERVDLPLTPEEALRDYPAASVRRVFRGPVGYAAVALLGLMGGIVLAAIGAGQ